MPVEKTNKRGRPSKKDSILPPKIESTENKPSSAPAKKKRENTIKTNNVTMFILEWLGKGDASAGLHKAVNHIVSLDQETIEKIRDK